jgi:hypothetical protein
MVKYRNVSHGRVVERPAEDEWLEASAGWERVTDELVPEAPAEHDEGSTNDGRH